MELLTSREDVKLLVDKDGNSHIQLGEDKPFKISNPKKAYKEIKRINNYIIKFHMFCVNGLTIWKDNRMIKDNIWSVPMAEQIINELN